jgi:GH24 family phage-related lysozyme (muramidase)
MPINKIVATKRGKAAIAAAILAAATAGWHTIKDTAPEKRVYPPAVILAVNTLIKPWEGLVLKAHLDRYAKIYDICYGKTRVNGKPVTANMSFTKVQCEDFLMEDIYNEYYLPMTQKISGFTNFPVGVQASEISGGYNFGVSGIVNSSAVQKFALKGQWRQACEAQTAYNKSGGEVLEGLVKRREMGDTQRAGEAEICVSGL